MTLGLLTTLAIASIGGRPTSREPTIEKLVYVRPDTGLVLEDPPGSTPKVLVPARPPVGYLPPCFFTDALAGRPACWSSVALAPSGRYVALHSVGGISVLTLDGREVAHIADSGKGERVTWSPVDDVMAVITDVSFIREENELGIVDPNGNVTRRIALSMEVKSLQGWSPDGRHVLVFGCAPAPPEIAGAVRCEYGAGRWDLWAVDIATGESVRLTDTPTVMEQQSAWSPDGSLVAYTSDCGDAWTPDGPCPWSIWTVRPDGTDRRRVTPEDGYVSAGPVWAPDGKHLAYTRDTTAPTDATVNGSVYVVDADGSDPHGITTFETGWAAVEGWSPDGSTIVVVHGVTDLATDEIDPIETWIMGADGSNPRLLVPGTFDVDWVWSSAE